MAIFNKIRMATERCPLDPPKWGAEPAVKDDDVRVVMNPVMDVVIPLASGNHGKKVLGSKWNNNELRYCLRSLEKHFPDLGRVFIVTEHLPDWLQNVEHIQAKDVHTRNKDANLIDKVLLACKSGVSPVFLRCSDDQCLLREFDGHEVWHLGSFGREGGGKWWKRYNNTCEYLKAHGKPTFFYDCHVPVPVAREAFIKVAEAAPYQEPPGMCINTLYFNFLDLPSVDVMDGQKATIHRRADIDTIRSECQNATFLGYNDDALKGDMERFLAERFPEPSRFEKPNKIIEPQAKPLPRLPVHSALQIDARELTDPAEVRKHGGPRIWTLWEGPMPQYVELGLQTMRLHNPDVVHLNYETFRELQDHDKDVDYSHLRMANQADWIRLYLLKHYGGVWIDADSIIMRSLQPMLDALGCCHSMTFIHESNKIGGAIIGGPANSPLIERMYNRATGMVRSKDKISWRAIMGANMDLVLKQTNWEGFLRLDRALFMPVMPHRNRGHLLTEASDEEFNARFPQPMFAQMLSHNIFPPLLRSLSPEEILEGRWLLSYFFRRAFGML